MATHPHGWMLTFPLAMALAWVDSLPATHPLKLISDEALRWESAVWESLGLPDALSPRHAGVRRTVLRGCMVVLAVATAASLVAFFRQ